MRFIVNVKERPNSKRDPDILAHESLNAFSVLLASRWRDRRAKRWAVRNQWNAITLSDGCFVEF
jgi:hypothetical protein